MIIDQESVMFSQYAAPERGGSTDRKPLSPSTLARMAANLGGDLCAGCNAPERARQLTPCHHVVCRDCARRSRDEEEDGCPVCHSQVFDDNSLLTWETVLRFWGAGRNPHTLCSDFKAYSEVFWSACWIAMRSISALQEVTGEKRALYQE